MKNMVLFLILFFAITAKSQNTKSMDSVYCDLRDFFISEIQLDSTLFKGHECKETIFIYEILTKESDLSVDFGVFVFHSTFIYDDFKHYLVKYKDKYFVFSAKDPMLVTNELLTLQEKYAEELDLNHIIKYIKVIGYMKAIDLGSNMIFSKTIGELEYTFPSHRYQ